jgi:tetratricopeptide (TPR) repeat protein
MKILLTLKEERWEDALTLSEQLRSLAPEGGASFIHGAFCLHELDRTLEAVELLLDGPDSLQDEPIFHYNLGCYQAAIGALEDARKCLRKSFNLDERLVDIARKDPDLKLLQDLL